MSTNRQISIASSLWIAVILSCWITLLSVERAGAQERHPSLEYQIKASLIFNFLQFVEWPADKVDKIDTDLILCLAGPNRFGHAVSAIQGQLVNGRRLSVEIHPDPEAQRLSSCDAIFFSSVPEQRSAQILAELSGAGLLTIGESSGFLGQGGIINLFVSDNKVRFEIDAQAAKRERLSISSKLLRLAQAVHGAGND